MNFREIARLVRERSGNHAKPRDTQIVNALGQNALRPHPLVPEAFEHLTWDDDNSIATEDAERWMTECLVPHFTALQAEWDDRQAQSSGYKAFEASRLAHMREVGYYTFLDEFEALHAERRTRKDVDGWLLKKYKDRQDEFPHPTPPTRDENLLAAEETYDGKRLKRNDAPWLRPFRSHSGDEEYSAADRERLHAKEA